MICSHCKQDILNCHCENFHPNIEGLSLSRDEIFALFHFMNNVGYISHEEYPKIHEIYKRLRDYLS